MKGFGNMMKEAQRLQREMERMQEEVGKKVVEATAGGGMVTAQANGKQELLAIKIDRSHQQGRRADARGPRARCH